MFNYLVIYGSNGLSVKNYGTIPPGYSSDEIAGLGLMAEVNHKVLNKDITYEFPQFKIYFKKDNEPYGKSIDGSILRILKGTYVNAVVSLNNEDDIIPAMEILKSNDNPCNPFGVVEGYTSEEVLEECIRAMILNHKTIKRT